MTRFATSLEPRHESPFALRFSPGAAAIVFLVVMVLGLTAGRSGFFGDPGTYWHLRLGREILASGDVPRLDSLTYTRDHTPWVDQSWLFDVLLAKIVERWGWPGAVALTSLGLAWIYSALTRNLEREGSGPVVAMAVGLLAAGMGSIHFLVRPHLFTFAGVLLTLKFCRAHHERGDRSIWLVPPLVALWANLHGGFLAGPIIVATAGIGHAAAWPWDLEQRRRLRNFGVVFVLSCLAPLANPYGPDLYRHVYSVLQGSQVTDLIDEYRPAPFGSGQARVLEWVILALVGLPLLSRRRPSRYDMAHALVWLHLALGSIRHAPLFAFAVAPVLARWLDGLKGLTPRSDAVTEGRFSDWPFLATLAVMLAAGEGWIIGGPSPEQWPLSALPTLNEEPVEARLFHEQDWGGLIESECQPRRLAYLDDRFELWGRDALLDYVGALQGGPDWDTLDSRRHFELVWLKPDRKLTRRLREDPNWRVIHSDLRSVLFRRKTSMPSPAGSGNGSR